MVVLLLIMMPGLFWPLDLPSLSTSYFCAHWQLHARNARYFSFSALDATISGKHYCLVLIGGCSQNFDVHSDGKQ